MNKQKLAKIGIILTIISLVGKLLGFLREVLLAKYFGTSYVVDAYLMSIYIPTILFGWLPAISVGYVPMYYDVDDKNKDKFTSNVLNIAMAIALIAIIFSLFFKEEIISLVAPGFSNDTYKLTIDYFKVTIWLILFNTPIQILISYLNCKNMFVFSNITNICLSLIQAIFVIISANINIRLLPLGILLSYIVQFIMLICFSKLQEFKYYKIIKIDKYIKKLFPLIIPIFISNSLVDINSFIDKFLASGLVEGSISALSYSGTLRSFILLVFTTAISTIFYPKLSEMISKKDYKKASYMIEKVIQIIILLFVPLTIGAILLSDEIIKCILFRGAFDLKSLEFTKWPFIMYSISLVFMALRDIIIKILYASKDSKANLIMGSVAILANIILDLILVINFKHVGLALATSLSCMIAFPGYVKLLKKRFNDIHFTKIFRCLTISIISSVIMSFFIIILKKLFVNYLSSSLFVMTLVLLLIIIIGSLAYIASIAIFFKSEIKKYKIKKGEKNGKISD